MTSAAQSAAGTRGRDEAGSVTLELALLAPLYFAVLALVVLAGRVSARRADLDGVAHAAARQISLTRDPTAALQSARSDAAVSLQEGAPTCRHMGWGVEVTATLVTVQISCQVDLSGTAMLPVPGTLTVTATGSEVVDTHREPG